MELYLSLLLMCSERERVIVYFSPTEGILAIKLLDMCQGTEHRSSARIVRALDH